MPTQELERRAQEEALAVLTEARAIIDAAENDELSKEDSERVDKFMTDYGVKKERADTLVKQRKTKELIEEEYEGFQRSKDSEEENGKKPTPHIDGNKGEGSDEQRAEQRLQEVRAFELYLRHGQRGLGPDEQRVLTEGTEEAGGFLVPEDFRAELIRRIPGLTVIRSGATIGQTSRDVVTIPKVTGGDDMFTSGVRITWAGETQTDDEGLTDPGFGQEKIPINKMIAKTRVSRDLLMDSAVDVSSLITELYAEAVAMGEDDAFINGSGVDRPEGILKASGIGNTNDAFDDLLVGRSDALIDVFFAVAAQYRNSGIWLMRSTTEAVIRKLKDSNNQYIWQPGLQAGAPGMILGRPVLSSEFMPANAQNNKVILFGDRRGFWIYDRLGTEIQRLEERYAEQGLVGYVLTRRLGGQVTRAYMFQTLTRTGA